MAGNIDLCVRQIVCKYVKDGTTYTDLDELSVNSKNGSTGTRTHKLTKSDDTVLQSANVNAGASVTLTELDNPDLTGSSHKIKQYDGETLKKSFAFDNLAKPTHNVTDGAVPAPVIGSLAEHGSLCEYVPGSQTNLYCRLSFQCRNGGILPATAELKALNVVTDSWDTIETLGLSPNWTGEKWVEFIIAKASYETGGDVEFRVFVYNVPTLVYESPSCVLTAPT